MIEIAWDDQRGQDPHIVNAADLGAWELHQTPGYNFELSGFNGENVITLIVNQLPSGQREIVVVHVQVCSHLQVHTETLPHTDFRTNGEVVTAIINRLLDEIE